MAYTDKSKIEAYLMSDIDNSFDAQIDNWISAAELYINNYTGKITFEISVETTRHFDGTGKSELQVDDFTSLSTIQILEANGTDVEFSLTEGQDSDFITFPYNESPKYKLIMTTNSQVATWLSGTKRIKLTGNWGNSTSVPKDIELVATILVAEIVKQGRDGGLVLSEGLGDYSTSFEQLNNAFLRITNVRKILDSYKIFELD